MKKFVLHTVGFAIGVLLLLHVLKLTLPYYWANEEMCDKMELFVSDQEGFDLVYFGPSAVKREFIPKVFDQGLRKAQIRSFNFGTAGVYYAEQSYLIRHAIIDSAFTNVQYVLSFGQEPKELMDVNFHKLRMKYCLDWANYALHLNYFWEKKDYQQLYRYTIMFIENQLFIGEVFDMVEWHFSDFSIPIELREKSGYVPYEWSVAQSKKSSNQRDNFLAKHEGKTYMAGSRQKPSKKKSKKPQSGLEQILIEDIGRLQSFANSNGIKFATVFKPNMIDYNNVDSLNSIYFGDGKSYQEYFEIENRWDHKHLNEKGSIVHTKNLAKLFEQEFIGKRKKSKKNTKKKKGKKSKDDKSRKRKKKSKGKTKKSKSKKAS